MAIDFPNSPTVGDTYTTNGKTYRWDGTVWGVYGTFTVDSTASDTEPTGVGNGHIWYRSDQSQTLIRYNDTWVEVGSAGGFDSSSTSFPSSLDSGTGFAAVEALQAKVGVDSSAVTSSHDYKIADHASRLTTLEGRKYVPVTAYSPTYTNFTLGNGTDTFYYAVSGDMMMIEGKIIFGSTTVFSTSASFYIPPAYKMTTYTLGGVITNSCQITYRETGVQDIIAHGKTSNADRILFLNDLANLTYLKEAIANGATPFTFASGDEIRIRAQFLIAEAP